MPITDKQFEQGLDETRSKVIDFLENHSDQAFLYREIAKEVGIPDKGFKKTYYELMFESMVVEGIVEKKILNMHAYFRVVKKDPNSKQENI